MSTPFYKLLDLAIIVLAALTAYWIRFSDWQLPIEYLIPTSVFVVCSTLSLAIFGFYGSTNSDVDAKKLVSAVSGIALAALLTTTFMYLTKTGETFSRIWFVLTFSMTLVALLVSRFVLARFFLTSLGERGILIIGDNQTARHAEKVLNGGEAGRQGLSLIKRVPYLENNAFTSPDKHPENGQPISEIWLSADIFANQPQAELELLLSDYAADLVYLPELPVIAELDKSKIESVMGIPTFNSSYRKARKLNIALKYLEDKLLSISLILILSPLLLVISAMIKFDSAGPVLYRQLRHGFAGKKFMIYKFRTMHHAPKGAKFSQATSNDPRVTKIGHWLRRSSLDELPQLFNVLQGDMSIVGPRPHPIELNQDFQYRIDKYMARHAVKPGITGLAQVRGFRGETATTEAMQNRVRCDLEYVQNWSVLLDIKILLNTVSHVISTDKAY